MKKFICFLLGEISMICAVGLLLPYLYSLIYENGIFIDAISYTILIAVAFGVALLGLGEKHPEKLTVTGGTVLLFTSWIIFALIGALPYIFTGALSPPDALMEALSGFTTTGLSNLPPGHSRTLVFWRSITQWLGGLNILFMLVTIMPSVTKGFGIFYAMPVSLRHSVMTSATIHRGVRKVTWVYILLTIIGLILFKISGLGNFDALNFSMVTISTGGCYTSWANMELDVRVFIAMVFGIIGSGCNVLVYFQAGSTSQLMKNIHYTFHNIEMRLFLLMMTISGLVISFHLYRSGLYSLQDSLGNGFFQVASFAATTGIMAERVLPWPDLDKLILLLLAVVGGCIGSMAGGFKMLRVIILLKTSWLELRRTLHPHMVIKLTVDNGTVPIEVISRILSFFFLYVAILMFSMMVLSLSGCSMESTMFLAIGCLTSTGQLALFQLTPSEIYTLPAYLKIFACFLMILGKVEILSFLILLQSCIQALQKNRW